MKFDAIRCNSLQFVILHSAYGTKQWLVKSSKLIRTLFFKGALNRTCEQTQQTHRLWSHLHVFDLAWRLCLRCPAHKAIAQIKGQKPFLSTPAASLALGKEQQWFTKFVNVNRLWYAALRASPSLGYVRIATRKQTWHGIKGGKIMIKKCKKGWSYLRLNRCWRGLLHL